MNQPRRIRKPIPPKFEPRTRWGAWERGVLSRLKNPIELQALILQRQSELDDDDAARDGIVTEFQSHIRARGGDPERGKYFISNRLIRDWLSAATGENLAPHRASAKLATMGIPQLKPSTRRNDKGHGGRGWQWSGPQSNAETPVLTIRETL